MQNFKLSTRIVSYPINSYLKICRRHFLQICHKCSIIREGNDWHLFGFTFFRLLLKKMHIPVCKILADDMQNGRNQLRYL